MLPLNNHSYYSILQSTLSPQQIVDYAISQGENYAALTDINGMHGLIQFAKYAEEKGIKPIIGAEIDDPVDKNIRAIFIAKNNQGYSKLCFLITLRKLHDKFRLLDVFDNSINDLFVITSSMQILNLINHRQLNRENYFAELIISSKSKKRTRIVYDFAIRSGIKIIASHPIYFESNENYTLLKILMAIKNRKTIDSISEEELIDSEFYFQSSKKFESDWSKLPEALESIDFIVRNSNVDMKFDQLKFPVYPSDGRISNYELLRKKAYDGMIEKYPNVEENIIQRLEYELNVINELGFSDYFLIVWDIVEEAKRRNMMIIGRGSAANSLVAFCLGFTQVDPIRYNLYFERFLNRGRNSPPDVDLDFSWKERDEIIKYIFEKYGYERVAMISTHITFRARSALREVAKVFGVPDSEISKFSKLIPWTSAKNLPELYKKFPEAKDLKFDSEPWTSIVKYASQLSSIPRHLSIHPSGIVISPEPINRYMALEFAKNKGLGLIITQPDMYSIEDFGLVKIDLLSQRSLSVLKDTMMKLSE